MTIRHLFLVSAAIMFSSSGEAARVPPNATPSYNGNWVCDSGYRRTGNKCVSRSGCNRKPSTCLRTFIKKKDYESASNLYNENRGLFLSSREKKRRKKELQALATHLQDSFNPRIDAVSKELGALKFDPLDSSTWPLIAQTLSSANKMLNDYRSHHILGEPEYQAASFPNLASQVYGLRFPSV